MSAGDNSETTPLETLLALQIEDSAADALSYRRDHLAERAELAELVSALAKNRSRVAELEIEKAAYEGRLTTLASEVAETVERAARIDERLRSGQAASFRDQEAMATEMGSLDHRRHDLDDEQLVVMEAIEPLETALTDLDDEHEELARRTEAVRAALRSKEAVIDADLAASRERRGKLIEPIPPPLLTEYERLRRRLDGVAVAHLVGGTCSGCHLAISASELERFRRRRPDEVITCEQCGRILVA